MFITLNDTKKLIKEGKVLHIAGDESLLNQLPQGNWIAGTTPYFITEQGGITSKDKLFVNEIAPAVEYKAIVYDKDSVLSISQDAYSNGMTILVMPFASEVATHYAKESPYIDDILMNPTIGWISGFDLSTKGSAKVYDGFNGTSYDDKAVALHINLPEEKVALIGIVNIFNVDNSDTKLEFMEDTLSVKNCKINGQEMVLADYIEENKINTQLPLVADYNSVLVNVSIKDICADTKTVNLYAPVFADKEYRFATPVKDYAASFKEHIQSLAGVNPVFSCNCILNYLYGELEGKATPPFAGPVTFGEVAYQLVNQTLVYMEIIDK